VQTHFTQHKQFDATNVTSYTFQNFSDFLIFPECLRKDQSKTRRHWPKIFNWQSKMTKAKKAGAEKEKGVWTSI